MDDATDRVSSGRIASLVATAPFAGAVPELAPWRPSSAAAAVLLAVPARLRDALALAVSLRGVGSMPGSTGVTARGVTGAEADMDVAGTAAVGGAADADVAVTPAKASADVSAAGATDAPIVVDGADEDAATGVGIGGSMRLGESSSAAPDASATSVAVCDPARDRPDTAAGERSADAGVAAVVVAVAVGGAACGKVESDVARCRTKLAGSAAVFWAVACVGDERLISPSDESDRGRSVSVAV